MRTHLIVGVIVAALVLSCVLFTPEGISHLSWSMQIRRAYRIEGESGYRVVKYNHTHTDGLRLAHMLAKNKLPRMVKLKHPPDQCEMWVRVRAPSIGDASPFLRIVAHVIMQGSFIQKKRKVQTAILVGTRYKLPEEVRFTQKGSFIRTSVVTVEPYCSVHHILERLAESIKAIRDDRRLCDTYAERLNMVNCQYIFNKWMLDSIARDDGRTLTLYRGGYRVSLKELLSIPFPMEMKIVRETQSTWVILASSMQFSPNNV